MTENNNNSNKKRLKAVGLISGGLDSTLAARIIKDLGVDVYGVYFSMPWGCCDKNKALDAAENIGIKLITLQLDERYLKIIDKPKHGYGRALNPCVDCRIHMFSRAAQYMNHIKADFVFTGEVLGQRNMSQLQKSLKLVERGCGLEGLLLRPLCAKALEPTEMENNGIIDRSKLLQIVGRSRKEQIKLAEELNVTEFSAPAGGCLLTNQNFALKMKDTLKYGYRNFRETIALKWGRHLRINASYKACLGRDKEENESLIRYAHTDDYIMQLEDNMGGTLILKGKNPSEEILSLCAGLIQHFSRYKNKDYVHVRYWPNSDRNNIKIIKSKQVSEGQIKEMYILK